MGRPTKRKKATQAIIDAVCGLDIGSTSARICLVTADGTKYMVDSGVEGDVNRHERGDFSTSFHPDGPGEPYLCNTPDDSRLSASLKPVLLLLSGVEPRELKPLISEYPQGDKLWGRINGPGEHEGFRERLETALKAFFNFLRRQTVQFCRDERLRVTSIGVALPGHWHPESEDYITGLILQHFAQTGSKIDISRQDVFYHSETQALAHYLFRNHARDLRSERCRAETFFLADFGGQNLNISTYSGQFRSTGEMAFFQIDEPEGVVGGGEVMDHHIGEYAQGLIPHANLRSNHEHKQRLIDNFHREKKSFDANHDIRDKSNGSSRLGGRFYYNGIEITLTPEIIGTAFEIAMEKPLVKVSELLKRWIRRKGRYPLKVVVAGGTAKSLALKARLVSVCMKRGLGHPVFQDEIQSAARFPSSHVAEGAALATASTMTVDEFMTSGAAVGVQVKEKRRAVWNSTASVVYPSKDKSDRYDEPPLELHLDDGEEVKLICNPFQDRRCKDMNYQQAYDLHTIGAFRKGHLQIRASYYQQGPSLSRPSFLIGVTWRPQLDRTPSIHDCLDGTLCLPLWLDKASCCVLVVEDEIKNDLPPEALMSATEVEADLPEAEGLFEGSPPPALGSPPALETTRDSSFDIMAPVADMQPNSTCMDDVSPVQMVESSALANSHRRPRTAHQKVGNSGVYYDDSDDDPDLLIGYKDTDWTAVP